MLNVFSYVWTKAKNRYRYYRTMPPRHRRLRHVLATTSPIAIPADGPATVRMLCGHSRLRDGIVTLKSFYRFPESAQFPAVFHDDGTMTSSDIRLLEYHLPGITLIRRAQADREVTAVLSAKRLSRCLAARPRHALFLKLFDFAVYSSGRQYLQLDSDVLFFQSPIEIYNGLKASDEMWVDLFNEDYENSYSWSVSKVAELIGVNLFPKINTGVAILRRDPSSFENYEQWLSIPSPGDYFLEQSMTAIESSRRSVAHLSAAYDVAGRYSKTADGVMSEHYCGNMRPKFYDHFCERIVKELATLPTSCRNY